MATFSNFKVWFWDNDLSALGSTTNVLFMRYKCAIDVAGEGEFWIPLADTQAYQYCAKNNVATFTCEIDGEQICFGEIVIDNFSPTFTPGEKRQVLKVSGMGRLSRLQLDRLNFQIISDGASGATSTAISDLLNLSQYTWNRSDNAFGGTSYVNASAFLVTTNETLLDAIIQAHQQNNHHVIDIPGRIGVLSGNEAAPENRLYSFYRMEDLSSSTTAFSGPHFTLNASESPSSKELPILSFEPIRNERELFTRAIVHGGGLGSSQFTIAAASGTKTAPSGYSYDFTNSVITNTTLEAVSNQPRKLGLANLSNIKPDDQNSSTSVLTAAEKLVDAGQRWLEERDGSYDEYYRIKTICKMTNTVSDQIPMPGVITGARITYSYTSPYNTSGAESDTTIINIDKVTHILEAEWSVKAGTGKEDNKLIGNYLLGPAPRQERQYGEWVANELKEMNRRLDHAEASVAGSSTPNGNNNVTIDAPLLTAGASAVLANERAGANGNGTIFTDNGAGTTFQTDLRTPLSVGNGSANSAGNSSTGHTHAVNLAATDIPPHVIATNTALGGQHTISGATSGHVLRASGATTAAFAQLQHSDLGGVSANQHHNQSHVLASTSGLGADHTVAGLTARQVLIATGATTALFRALEDADIPASIARDSEVTTAVSTHTADADAHHNWPLLDADIPSTIARDSEVTSAISTHASNANAHHNRSHSITSASDHTVTGAALDVVGLTATNTLGILTPSAAVSTAVSALLKTDSNGRLQVQGLGVGTAATGTGVLDVSTKIYINDTADANVTTGLVINQGTADNGIITLKSSEVAHGITDYAETDTYGYFGKSGSGDDSGPNGDASGGLLIRGFRDADGLGVRAMVVAGYLGEAADTTTALGSGGSQGVVQLTSAIKSGSGIAAVADSGNALAFYNGGVTSWLQKGDGTVYQRGGLYLNDTANAFMTVGLTINQGADDGEIVALKSSDIAHGITDSTETDTFAVIKKLSATDGGATVRGYTEATRGIELLGIGTTGDTTKNSSASAYAEVSAVKKSGTGLAVAGANENIFAVRSGGVTKFIVDAEGDTHRDGSDNTYDTYHDAHLARAFDRAVSPGSVIDSDFDSWVQYGREDLVKAGILHESGFYNESRLLRLAIGAVWQEYTERQRLAARVMDLERRLLDA